MLKEFKEFAMKGNIVDMAIGVVIGGAFGKIVNSLVEDIILPLVGILIGKVDFSSLAISVGESNINYGLFINSVVQFLIISFSIFIVIKNINRFNQKEEVIEEVTTKSCPHCLSEINIAATRCPNCTSELVEN